MTVVKQINNVDFGIMDGYEVDDDDIKIKIKTVHGDVLVVKGLIKEEPESLMTLGIIEGEDVARIAFYKPLDELEVD